MPWNNSNAAVPIKHFFDSNASAPALVPDFVELLCRDHSYTTVQDVVQMKERFRKPKFTLHDDITIAHEVRKFCAHVAFFVKVHAEAAQHANKNKNFSMLVTAKLIQDRYKKIQDYHRSGEIWSRRMSDIGEEHREGDKEEMYDSLAEMVYAHKL